MIIVHDMMSTQDDLQRKSKAQAVIQRAYSAKIRQVMNGEYSYTLNVHMGDPAFKYIKPFSIIESNTGQYFFVQKIKDDQIYCPHIWYYLAHRPVWTGEHKGYDIWDSVRDILEDGGDLPDIVKYRFSFSSDISNEWRDWNFYRKRKAYAILGAPNSIVNMFGGEIYRDNFYFSINHRMQYSSTDAFMIIDGYNAAGISYEIDISDMITEAYGIDNYDNEFGVSIVPSGTFPHQITGMPQFSYNSDSYLADDVKKYFGENNYARESVSVNFATLRKSNKDSPFLQLEDYRLGDEGIVRSDIRGLNARKRIIERTYDDLNGRTIDVKLGNYIPSMYMESRYGKLLAKDDSPGRRLDAIERRQNNYISRSELEEILNNRGGN